MTAETGAELRQFISDALLKAAFADWDVGEGTVIELPLSVAVDAVIAAIAAAPVTPGLDEADLRVDVWRNGAVAPEMQHCAVRITHLPTGTTVTKEGRSALQAKAEALAELGPKVAEALSQYRTSHDPVARSRPDHRIRG